MITLRKAVERGHADHGWLKSEHSFSFADYYDPAHMGVGNLRVINEDRIAPGTGFGTHGHRDMEIVSYVIEGALAHRDSLGNEGVIRPGDVQRMSAGTGVRHSEFNGSVDATTHFLQIWFLPDRAGIAPGYEQQHFGAAAKRGRLALVAAPGGRDGALTIHADATLAAGLFDGAERAEIALDPARIVYVQLVRGTLQVNGHPLAAGDALRLDAESKLIIESGRDAEVLVFDLAP
ncbi:MAG: pirin family protein [Burkholderiales bacterium]|nr:pirin family protein [Burkholderiales bacterium]